jgi:hypothetical protein
MEGTHPLAGRYRGKKRLTEATFERLGQPMKDGVRLKLGHLYIDSDTTITGVTRAAMLERAAVAGAVPGLSPGGRASRSGGSAGS